MGMTFAVVEIANPADPKRSRTVKCLVDTGALYSLIQRPILTELGIKAHSEKTFHLANGEEVTRQIGDALFSYEGETAASRVIFGEPGDSDLFGSVSLESLGFMVDPLQRILKPLPMVLG